MVLGRRPGHHVVQDGRYWANRASSSADEQRDSSAARDRLRCLDGDLEYRGGSPIVNFDVGEAEVLLRVVHAYGRAGGFPRPQEVKEAQAGRGP